MESFFSKRFLAVFMTFHFALWATFSRVFDVHADMADHWMAGKFFSLSYYEHPPLISWLFGALQWVYQLVPLIDQASFLKWVALGFHGLIFWQAYRLAKLVLPDYKAEYVILLASSLFFSLGMLFINIDHPLLFFWLLAMQSFVRYLKSEKNPHLLMMGVYLGLAALSKYTAVLFYLSLAVYFLLSKKRWPMFWNPYVWLAGLISLLIFSPVLYWNFENDFASFIFQFSRGLTGGTLGANLLGFSFAHLLLYSPIFAFFGWLVLFANTREQFQHSQKNDPMQFFWTSALVILLFFSLAALRGSIADPKWMNLGYLALYLFLLGQLQAIEGGKAGLLQKFSFLSQPKGGSRLCKISVRFLAISYTVNVVFAIYLYAQAQYYVLPFPDKLQQKIEETKGWSEINQDLDDLLAASEIEFPPYVVTREYQLGAWFALYNEHQPLTHSIEKPLRNLWSPLNRLLAKGFLLICPPEECAMTVFNAANNFGLDESEIQEVGEIVSVFPSERERVFYVYLYDPKNHLVVDNSLQMKHHTPKYRFQPRLEKLTSGSAASL